jgi:hypothetical protein
MEKETVLLLILIILLFVLYYFSGCKSDTFANLQAEQKDTCVILMVFLTKQCPHCKTYDNHQHAALANNLAQHNIKVKKVYADEDEDNLFDQHGVMFVPAAMVMKGDKKEKVNGAITHENVVNTAKKL